MTGYNGWTNYETWAVNLWLMNDQGSEEMIRELVADVLAEPVNPLSVLTPEEQGRYAVAEALKNRITDPDEGIIPDLGASLAGDLLGAALCEVNWSELAETYIQDFPPAETADALPEED